MTTIQPSAPTIWGSTLRDMAANLTHDAGCFQGQKPDMDCDKCRLEGALRELEMQAEQIERKQAEVVMLRQKLKANQLEVMPAQPAIERAAAYLCDWDGEHLPFNRLPESERTAWLALATKVLRAAAGLAPTA